jgi:two-component system, sensor histidine kinase and response regulator
MNRQNEINTINILLVDDIPENLIVLETLLAKEGRTFFKATSGNEALKILLNEPVGLILLDVQMPEMDGFEVAQLIKKNPKTKDIAIIFVTAINKEEKYIVKGLEEGAVDYLFKPLDVKVTQAKVNVFEELYFQRKTLKDSYDEIEKVNKQLDQFVYIVSHDLKAPLRAISGLASWIENDLKNYDNPSVKEKLDLLVNRVGRMQNMITGILNYSRARRTKEEKEDVDIKELLESIIDLLSPPENIKIRIPDKLPTLKTERIKIQQVFQNLISNAIKYNDKPEGIIEIYVQEQPEKCIFTVKDNGSGIPKEFYESIFQIFQTVKPKDEVESTGVGLTIVKTIVEDQGGTIKVESEVGKGTSFIFDWKK